MKKQFLSLGLVLAFAVANAQTYQTISLSGFNADVIANGIGAASSSTNASLDKPTDNFAYMSKDYKLTSTSATLTYGLPENGLIASAAAGTSGLTFQLAPYSANNSLRLPNANDTGTLTFAIPGSATTLYVLAVSGSGPSTGEITVNFQDGTTQVFANTSFQDWYDGTSFAIQGIGRINRNSNGLENGGGTNPRIYQIPLTLSTANQSKMITSVTVKKTSTDVTVVNVFAISAQGLVLSVSDAKAEKKSAVYPNPFTDSIYFDNIKDLASVSIVDFTGRTLMKDIQPQTQLDLSSLESGNYTVVLKFKNGTQTSKKVIKK
ncbi:T9SS type A sorting domain-containing protein [Chryseobacterium caseinilyticum]|uniref:T9SS type A sorting domain-containing protein n=1 Tax=Chryseobacterium caseinilyticum TaxID=2771428 RepID=A0ABR8ZCT5_9FLAO|nr:T9SS type A sorting domain-containing protein [Chryseobacterium caseinilyticum]MBD8082663.1 T9SS type A sorting domain-containing protein [Chryseobacterium caseinilyticum]